jgi:4-hydroxythreonine-4-phosphate dehydrogenase
MRCCRPLVVGSEHALSQGIEIAGADLRTRKVTDPTDACAEPGFIDVLDSGVLDPAQIRMGEANAHCGRANGLWLVEAANLALSGVAQASVMAPVTAEALALGKAAVGEIFGMDPSARYLTLLSGPLRVVHVFDHVMLEDVCRDLKAPLVVNAIRKTHTALRQWGIENPRIAVAGFNPHAHGPQEEQAIEPAVLQVHGEGIDVTGPIPPDTVFRHGIDGRYDVVIAMFHDQGHIAIKTWGFAGNCALFLGAPYLFLSVGHGSAYDIAGQGIANHEMILAAILQSASLAAGKGFID